MSKTGTFHLISELYHDFPKFIFWPILMLQKSILWSFFAFFVKIWPNNMYAALNPDFFVWPFVPGDLRWPWTVLWSQRTQMILTDVSDTIHTDSLALFALNIEFVLADVTKPEKSKILTLTWPVTPSVPPVSAATSRSNFLPCTGSSRKGLSNGVWNLEIGQVV